MLVKLKKKLRTHAVRLALYKPVPYSESLFLNRLGMQALRTFVLYLWRLVRYTSGGHLNEKEKEYLAVLERDGIVVIPNFLSEPDRVRIREEYTKLIPSFKPSYSAVLLPHVERIHADSPLVSDFFRTTFCENKTIRTIQTAYLKCKYNLPIDPNITRIFCLNDEEIKSPKNGGTNNLHIDAPVRTLKAFYYVSDTERKNAALKYCIGSHRRNTFKRQKLEYDMSIRFAKNKGNTSHQGEYGDDEPWVTVTPQEMEMNTLKESDMEVKANTLVLVDTGGFHRRGESLSTTPRETVEISFRSIDTLKNAFYSIISRFHKESRRAEGDDF